MFNSATLKDALNKQTKNRATIPFFMTVMYA